MAPSDSPPAEAARRLEVLLDLIGCLSTPPTGYLLDPAYRGLLDEEERRLSDALVHMAEAVPEESPSTATAEVRALLRRLGHDVPDGDGGPADGTTDRVDDRVQEQRPG